MPSKKNEFLTLFSLVNEVSGIGKKTASALEVNGFRTVMDFLKLLPKRFEDRTKVISFSELKPEDSYQGVFKASVKNSTISHFGKNKCVIYCTFVDEKGASVSARWFNQPYLHRSLVAGNWYFLFGKGFLLKGKPALDNPEIELIDEECEKAEKLVKPVRSLETTLTPVYSPMKALTDCRFSPKAIRKTVRTIINTLNWEKSFPSLSENTPFPKLRKAFTDAHFPCDLKAFASAKIALGFLDQLLFQMAVLKRREKKIAFEVAAMSSLPSTSVPLPLPLLSPRSSLLTPASSPSPLSPPSSASNNTDIASFQISELISSCNFPFELTDSQIKSTEAIISLISQNRPVSIMLQGDVGCGKTIVAFLAVVYYCTKISDSSVIAFMAPTEPLARQHFRNFGQFFPDYSVRARVLTGDTSKTERIEIQNDLLKRNVAVLFGTHALFQDKLNIPGLSFCIIDEQQRFGVEQRKALIKKAESAEEKITPHLMMISATPIPRTLTLTIFGDLDLVSIEEKPAGRKPVETMILSSREDSLLHIEKHLSGGGQVYFLCPLIEDSEKSDNSSVREVHGYLKSHFPSAEIASLSGKSSSVEKEEIISNFRNGKIGILIATTVVEVGIDNQNASLMVIENAERFGLSQLHQLRGRVGRGTRDSQCVMICRASESQDKLKILLETDDGFKISMTDLKFRGPGDICGTRQSGLNHPAMQTLESPEMILNARRRASEILNSDDISVKEWFIERMYESFGGKFSDFMEGG
ncbi:MAG: ATP-dependent DNA helicase RecG [Candidatus Riflebacteria bacterium]|nr:ATP-dependent DNA helicase RecG [Candidatus Riflebacteria bacterium]